MTEFSPAFLKGLFAQLVKCVGGVDAAGAFLACSAERVSQLQRMNCADLPTWSQVATLEVACGQSIVFAGLAKLAVGETGKADLLKEACELTEAAVDLQRTVRNGGTRREINAAAARVQREAADIPPALAVIAGGQD